MWATALSEGKINSYLEESRLENQTPRVLARLTSEELAMVVGAMRPCCPDHQTVDMDCNPDVGGYTIILDSNTCD